MCAATKQRWLILQLHPLLPHPTTTAYACCPTLCYVLRGPLCPLHSHSLEKVQELALCHALSVATHVHVVGPPVESDNKHQQPGRRGSAEEEQLSRQCITNTLLLKLCRDAAELEQQGGWGRRPICSWLWC